MNESTSKPSMMKRPVPAWIVATVGVIGILVGGGVVTAQNAGKVPASELMLIQEQLELAEAETTDAETALKVAEEQFVADKLSLTSEAREATKLAEEVEKQLEIAETKVVAAEAELTAQLELVAVETVSEPEPAYEPLAMADTAPAPAAAPAPEYAYYKNCTAARAAGAAPVYAGDPGYAKHLDRDGDGIGCE